MMLKLHKTNLNDVFQLKLHSSLYSLLNINTYDYVVEKPGIEVIDDGIKIQNINCCSQMS